MNRTALGVWVLFALLGSSTAVADKLSELDELNLSTTMSTIPEAANSVLDHTRWSEIFRVDNVGTLSCGNFDPMLSVKNSFTEAKGRVKQTLAALPDAIESSLDAGSLAAGIMQRSMPQTYEQMMNGIAIGFDEFNLARGLCEQVQTKLLDAIPESEYKKVAQKTEMESINKTLKSGGRIDIVDVFGNAGSSKSPSGDAGLDTPEGKRGGAGTPRLFVNDTAKYGYEKITAVTGSSEPALPINKAVPKTMRDYFKSGQEIKQYVDSIVGTIAVATCDDCKTREVKPGLGIAPLIQETAVLYYQKLDTLVKQDLNTVTQDKLNEISVHPLASVTLSIVKNLKTSQLQARRDDMSLLAYDLATAEHIQKMEYAKHALMVGKSVPEFVGNGALGADVDTQVALLDSQLDSILRMHDAKQVLGTGASERILRRKQIENKYLKIRSPQPGVN
ncbi:hypothetical protein L1D14_10660 [Vibrio tubiashii]|uniref:hypothetical protein n=1 Tax=Vibrio tubiashii TaxID=29498 RepID=UPI001EFE64BF|nr:hypothetical protein [Vibrio tubiashii]MCG9576699.1 hypothetical protein [Vibrio tubiashii]